MEDANNHFNACVEKIVNELHTSARRSLTR